MLQGTSGNGSEVRANVAIVGGGPAGAVAAATLRLQSPDQTVVILEKQAGPKPPAGQILLPLGAQVLQEIGAWAKVESLGQAPFAGASYIWGQGDQPWAFDHVPAEPVAAKPHPGGFAGLRASTGFRVERSAYDDTLLAHAEGLGASILKGVAVTGVETAGDRIERLTLGDGRTIVANMYLDASGPTGVLARALSVPTNRVAGMNHRMVSGVLGGARPMADPAAGVRAHIRSLSFGWAWALPLPGERLAVGVVVPAEILEANGQTPEQLIQRAQAESPDFAALTQNAQPLTAWRVDDATPTLAARMAGENWLLCGGAAGVSEPILMAELMLAHTTGREAGYTLAAARLGQHNQRWLLTAYTDKTRRHFELHARLAQLWYAGNRQMPGLAAHTAAIARASGLRANAQHAWAWLTQGGLTATSLVQPKIGSLDIGGARALVGQLTEGKADPRIELQGFNVLKPNLVGARQEWVADFREGAVHRVACYTRNGRVLPVIGVYERLLETLKHHSVVTDLLAELQQQIRSSVPAAMQAASLSRCIQGLESMLQDGWLIGKLDRRRPVPQWTVNTPSPIRPIAVEHRTLATPASEAV